MDCRAEIQFGKADPTPGGHQSAFHFGIPLRIFAMSRAFLYIALIAITDTRASAASNQKDALISASFSSEKVSLAYPSKYYRDAKILALPKKTNGDEPGPPFNVGPARYVIELTPHRQAQRLSGRYYYPSYSVIYVTPLHDETVADFDKTYPGLSSIARLLHQLLKDRPNDLYTWTAQRSAPSHPWRLPDEH